MDLARIASGPSMFGRRVFVCLLPILLACRREKRTCFVADAESAGPQDASDLVDQGMQRIWLLNESRDIGAAKPPHRGLLRETR